MPVSNKLEQQTNKLLQIISDFDGTTHGNANYSSFSEITREINKTSKIIPILNSFMLINPVKWDDINGKIWTDEKTRLENQFYFLQGDLLRTNRIVTIDEARSENEFEYCVARQPTCELIKGRSEEHRIFRVSPCQIVRKDDINSNRKKYDSFAIACRFNSPKFFPLPPLVDDQEDVLGYIIYLSLPYFLTEKDAADAVQLSSLSISGWHLFNAAIQHAETRANMIDELKLRTNIS